MKIIATSDTHGYLPEINETFDLLLHAGDVCPAYNHYGYWQKGWLETKFVEWVNGLNFADFNSKVILVPGNHDFFFEEASKAEIKALEEKCNGRLIILVHGEYEHEYAVSDGLDSLVIFGTPYCSIFGRWAFMVNDSELERKYSQISDKVDILVSHDSPNINRLGAILQGPWKNEGAGNKILAEHIKRVNPRLFVSGHFHSGNHTFEKIGNTIMGNVSYVDEEYSPAHRPVLIHYDEEHREWGEISEL